MCFGLVFLNANIQVFQFVSDFFFKLIFIVFFLNFLSMCPGISVLHAPPLVLGTGDLCSGVALGTGSNEAAGRYSAT